MKKKIVNFIIWQYYNFTRLDITADLDKIAKQYLRVTGKKGKYCTCKNRGKAVNYIWKDWHCTYCLKPKKT